MIFGRTQPIWCMGEAGDALALHAQEYGKELAPHALALLIERSNAATEPSMQIRIAVWFLGRTGRRGLGF
jgi:hypothetical protein